MPRFLVQFDIHFHHCEDVMEAWLSSKKYYVVTTLCILQTITSDIHSLALSNSYAKYYKKKSQAFF